MKDAQENKWNLQLNPQQQHWSLGSKDQFGPMSSHSKRFWKQVPQMQTSQYRIRYSSEYQYATWHYWKIQNQQTNQYSSLPIHEYINILSTHPQRRKRGNHINYIQRFACQDLSSPISVTRPPLSFLKTHHPNILIPNNTTAGQWTNRRTFHSNKYVPSTSTNKIHRPQSEH